VSDSCVRKVAMVLTGIVGLLALATGPVSADQDGPNEPDMICGTCEPGGGPPGPTRILTVYPRLQGTNLCGPASGQVIINFTRGIGFSNKDGENAATNYKVQSEIKDAMHTDGSGTDRWGYTDGLDAYALKPAGTIWDPFGGLSGGDKLYSKIVTDIWTYGVPMAVAVIPHPSGSNAYLPSWPNVATTPHWIAVHGYEGGTTWTNSNAQMVWFADSSGNGGVEKGKSWSVGALKLWKVNDANQASGVWLKAQ
jgi:hypothetical protein